MSDNQKGYDALLEEINAMKNHISRLQQIIVEAHNQVSPQKKSADNKSKYVYTEKKSTPTVNVGSIVRYGTYPQTESGTDKTPIEWQVLKVQGNRALLLSRYGLDALRFDEEEYLGWAMSEIRTWLNYTFLNAAFTSKEQQSILTTLILTPHYNGIDGGSGSQDMLWLLCRDEIQTYLKDRTARNCIPTAYAKKKGSKKKGWWWLRSPGFVSTYASSVDSDGDLNYGFVTSTDYVVRPAFWLNLVSATID